MKWINQPGNYTGDTWHIGAALILQPDLHVIQTVMDAHAPHAQQARTFYRDLGIDPARIVTCPTTDNLEAGLRLSRPIHRVRYNDLNVKLARRHLRGIFDMEPTVLPVYKATSIYLNASTNDPAATTSLRNLFTAHLERGHPDVVAQIRRTVDAMPPNAVLIIGRYARYMADFNADDAKVAAIAERARSHGRPCCLVADSESGEAQNFARRFELPIADPYHLHRHIDCIENTGRVDMCGTATFWKLLSSPGRDHIVIGGRSGSVDAAAYLGLNVVEWDMFHPCDPESYRLAIMAPRLCSTLALSRVDDFACTALYSLHSPSQPHRRETMMARDALSYAMTTGRVGVIHQSDVKHYVVNTEPHEYKGQ